MYFCPDLKLDHNTSYSRSETVLTDTVNSMVRSSVVLPAAAENFVKKFEKQMLCVVIQYGIGARL